MRDAKSLSNFISEMSYSPKSGLDLSSLRRSSPRTPSNPVNNKGIMSKVISLFSRFHPNSKYRFWLASCIESFLRGSNEANQFFVAHTGLLYSLVSHITTQSPEKLNSVQISYDLIGEIVKLNKYNIIFLGKICEQFDWTKTIIEHAKLNIVDSNVFIRALVLSFEKFDFADRRRV